MEENKTVCREYLDAIGRGDAAGVRSCVTDDFVHVQLGTSSASGRRDLQGVLELVEMLDQITVSGVDFTFESMTEERNRVATLVTGKSELIGGGRYDNIYSILFHLRDGRIFMMEELLDTKYLDTALAGVLGGIQTG
ncbi:nuclear transport factor 2 family protein [Rhodococcus sp. NPDC057529]|uniref:nuclear transport factor 2 family protein n=1 Tax=Rhodococcus sp. NPDC057529 TaxID=3346158 RepID=UPI00367264B1